MHFISCTFIYYLVDEQDWIFMSVHFWGEDPRGTWTLAVTDNSNNNRRHYRSKVKHGDLEDATEALQDELLGRPRLQEDDIEGSSQAHEGVLEKSERNAETKVSEDFEGILESGHSYFVHCLFAVVRIYDITYIYAYI